MAVEHPPFYVPEILPIGEALLTHGLTNVGALYPVGALVFGATSIAGGLAIEPF